LNGREPPRAEQLVNARAIIVNVPQPGWLSWVVGGGRHWFAISPVDGVWCLAPFSRSSQPWALLLGCRFDMCTAESPFQHRALCSVRLSGLAAFYGSGLCYLVVV
jgi:hypothetical protein